MPDPETTGSVGAAHASRTGPAESTDLNTGTTDPRRDETSVPARIAYPMAIEVARRADGIRVCAPCGRYSHSESPAADVVVLGRMAICRPFIVSKPIPGSPDPAASYHESRLLRVFRYFRGVSREFEWLRSGPPTSGPASAAFIRLHRSPHPDRLTPFASTVRLHRSPPQFASTVRLHSSPPPFSSTVLLPVAHRHETHPRERSARRTRATTASGCPDNALLRTRTTAYPASMNCSSRHMSRSYCAESVR